jgi:uncharacterized membrane protein
LPLCRQIHLPSVVLNSVSLPDDQKFANLVNALNEVLARQDRLEARLTNLEQSLSIAVPAPAVPMPVPMEPVPVIESAAPFATPRPALESKVGLTILNRIGGITLVLGVAFFFKWAVDNNWIGPSGRVILGLLAGFAALAVADLLWRKGQQIFAQGITGTGIAIVYLACYAAFDFYRLISQPVAFILLLATTIMAATLAIRYSAIAVAALGFFGAYLIPLLLSNGEDHPWFLMTYLLVINVAATYLAAQRGWRPLELLSFAATIFIFGGWLFKYGDKPADQLSATSGVLAFCAQRFRTAWPVLFLFTQALAALSVAYIWQGAFNFSWLALLVAAGGLAFVHVRKYAPALPTAFVAFWLSVGVTSLDNHSVSHVMPVASAGFVLFAVSSWWRNAILDESPGASDMSVFALNGAIYYSVAYSVLQHDYHHWLGLLAVAVAASYLAFGMFLYRKSAAKEADMRMVLLALGVSVAFLTLAIPIQLTGFTVTIGWAIQAAALTWIGVRLSSTPAVRTAFAIFALALLLAGIADSGMYSNAASYTLLLNTRFLTFAVLGAAFLLAGYWSAKLERQFALVHFIAGHLTLLCGLSLEGIGWAERSAARENRLSVETVGMTILFAGYAVMLVSFGVATRSAVSRVSGLVLTAVVILKLYLFDVWQLSRVYQVIAFVILGILLLSTSFLYSRFKNLISDWSRADKTAK